MVGASVVELQSSIWTHRGIAKQPSQVHDFALFFNFSNSTISLYQSHFFFSVLIWILKLMLRVNCISFKVHSPKGIPNFSVCRFLCKKSIGLLLTIFNFFILGITVVSLMLFIVYHHYVDICVSVRRHKTLVYPYGFLFICLILEH